MSGAICGDNRFEIIETAKKLLLFATNIETSPDEMKCLDAFLFRCWQMKWIDEKIFDQYEKIKTKYENM